MAPTSVLHSRWLLFGFALAVLAGDLASKSWAVGQLASPIHPFLAWRSAQGSPAEDLRRAGVSQETLDQAIAHGALAKLRKAELSGATAVSPAMVGLDLVVGDGIAMPAPRRLRLGRDHLDRPLGEVLGEAWRVDAAKASALLKDQVWTASFRPFDPTQAWQPEDAGVALLDRDLPLLPSNLRLVYAENKGAAWSFLEGAPQGFRVALFATISSIASIAMAFWLWRRLSTSALMAWSIAAILGGAVGNLVDRLRYSVVIDFIYMYAVVDGRTHGWPVYNVADIGITVGVALIALESLRARPQPVVHQAASGPA